VKEVDVNLAISDSVGLADARSWLSNLAAAGFCDGSGESDIL